VKKHYSWKEGLRIKKIIYDSIDGNKSTSAISKSLNLPEEKVKNEVKV
jgi:hypothetical protein